jgi:hypothetical protein
VIRIEPVVLDPDKNGGRKAGWRWRCESCGVASSRPWTDRPSEVNAAAEHDLVVGERPVAMPGAWLR